MPTHIKLRLTLLFNGKRLLDNGSIVADEGFPRQVSQHLRELGHDVLTVQEAGQANQRIPDEAILTFATDRDRTVSQLIEQILSVCIGKILHTLALSCVQKILIAKD